MIARACRERGAVMVPAGEGVRADVAGLDGGMAVVDLDTPVRRYGRLRLALRGRHQVQNAVVAVRLLEVLGESGVELTADAVVAAATAVRWPGRLDLLSDRRGRTVLCDSAHNPAGAARAGRLPPRGPPGRPADRLRDHEGQGRRGHAEAAAPLGDAPRPHACPHRPRARPRRPRRGGAPRRVARPARGRTGRGRARSSGRGRTRPPCAPRARSSWSARCSRDGVARDILAGFPDPLWFQHACVLTDGSRSGC